MHQERNTLILILQISVFLSTVIIAFNLFLFLFSKIKKEPTNYCYDTAIEEAEVVETN